MSHNQSIWDLSDGHSISPFPSRSQVPTCAWHDIESGVLSLNEAAELHVPESSRQLSLKPRTEPSASCLAAAVPSFQTLAEHTWETEKEQSWG